MIKICNNRSVFPNSIKISNQYENDTRSIDFDLSDIQFTGNTYLICKYQGQSTFYAPLLLDENYSIPVETFLSAQPGAYTCVIVISTVTIDADYNFSSDNPLFVSNEFTLNVDPNFLTGTATAWELTPAAQNYFDQLIVLVDKVREDLDSGAFIGNGIKSITLISTVGLVDTYQILFTNGSTFDFQVTNGATPTITIQDGVWFVNGISTGVSALGQKGDKGDPGVGIVSIEETSTSGNVDTYTITFTNQTTSTFTVTNGTDGKDGVTPNIQIGTVTTLPAGSQATATITGTPKSPILNLGIPEGETGGTTNYNDLENKPQINGVELSGNKSGNDIGLVNNQQGTANAGKVLGIGQDGLVIPVENAGASDNIIYKDVPKQLNPNITDGFLRAMWSLKLYGQSSQGADPSPSNKQDITAISQFEGATTGGNLFDFSQQTTQIVKYFYSKIIDNLIIGQSYTASLDGDIGSIENAWFYINTTGGPDATNIIRNSSGTVVRKEITFIATAKTMYLVTNKSTNYDSINYFKIELGETATPYTPYVSQPFSYTPTNPMYSTQDGSICDYVDVEKGVEVYNIKFVTLNGSESGWYKYKDLVNGGIAVALSNWANKDDIEHAYNNRNNYYLVDNFKYTNVDSTSNSTGLFLVNKTNSSWILFTVDFATLEEFKQWASENPITVGYVSLTPTETPIDPEQLAMLRALYTYTGVTNLLCNAPVSFTYERSLQIVINNLENGVNTNALNIAVKE